jgi:hypothetical protein
MFTGGQRYFGQATQSSQTRPPASGPDRTGSPLSTYALLESPPQQAEK